MAISFSDLQTEAGIKSLDGFLAGKAYISGDQLTKDDIKVFAAVLEKPSGGYPNASRWYETVSSHLATRFPGKAVGVRFSGQAATTVAASAQEVKKEVPEGDDDDDLDLFGEETEEEKKAAEEREAAVKASSKKKESLQMSPASSSVRKLDWAPKCPCGHGFMILKTSRTAQNPGRRFWKCPDLHGEGGCGFFIWMDEAAIENSPVQSMGCVQSERRDDEIRTLLEEMKQEMKQEIKSLRESVEAHNVQRQHPNYTSYILMMFILFVAYVWGPNLATRA